MLSYQTVGVENQTHWQTDEHLIVVRSLVRTCVSAHIILKT